MRRTLVLFLVASFLFTACKYDEYPVFVKVENITITESTPKGITIKTNLQFLNPNQIGGTLQVNDLHVFVNQLDLGSINSSDFYVPPKKEFSVPVSFEISYDKIIGDKEGLLNNLFTTLIDKKLDINYKGIVQYKLGIISYDYPVDYSETIQLKKKK
jgi:hypothetical protein